MCTLEIEIIVLIFKFQEGNNGPRLSRNDNRARQLDSDKAQPVGLRIGSSPILGCRAKLKPASVARWLELTDIYKKKKIQKNNILKATEATFYKKKKIPIPKPKSSSTQLGSERPEPKAQVESNFFG